MEFSREMLKKLKLAKAPTKPKVFIAGIVLGAAVCAIVAFNLFRPVQKVKYEVEQLSPSTVFERIVAQNEMVSASQSYNIVDKVTDTQRFFDLVDIPWTTKSFWYRYTGTIKAGVNLQTAEYAQDPDDSTHITVTLDSPYIVSNEPNMDKSGCLEENNNVLNPIHVEDVDAFQAQCKERSQAEVVDGGLFEEAKNNAETNIHGMFQAALGEECTIDFVYRDAENSE